jgi:hypothetical protein
MPIRQSNTRQRGARTAPPTSTHCGLGKSLARDLSGAATLSRSARQARTRRGAVAVLPAASSGRCRQADAVRRRVRARVHRTGAAGRKTAASTRRARACARSGASATRRAGSGRSSAAGTYRSSDSASPSATRCRCSTSIGCGSGSAAGTGTDSPWSLGADSAATSEAKVAKVSTNTRPTSCTGLRGTAGLFGAIAPARECQTKGPAENRGV